MTGTPLTLYLAEGARGLAGAEGPLLGGPMGLDGVGYTSDNTTIDSGAEDTGVRTMEATLFILGTLLCIVMTVVGNILVILSVFTYRPLRCVQNFFIVSLACADILVAVCVMPLNVANYVIGRWIFGATLCNMWLTFDILMCTASILNLCAIALDRYYAIHDPINYAQKRTVRRVLLMISILWVVSMLISVPPLLGWNNSNGRNLYNQVTMVCELTDQKSFVVYSASGSFFIPLFIMTFVYINIFLATRRRLRKRAQAAAMAGGGGGTPTHKHNRRHQGGDNKRSISLRGEPSSDETPEPTCILVNSNNTINDKCSTPANNNEPPRASLQGDPLLPSKPGLRHTHSSNALLSPHNAPRNGSLKSLTSLASLRESLKARGSPRTAAVQISNGSGSQVEHFMAEKQRISLSRERRAARTMSVIMGVFVLCWLPFFLMYIIFPFCPSCAQRTPGAVVNFIVWLGYINSALNPVIYTVFNLDFRRAFKRLLQCQCNYRR